MVFALYLTGVPAAGKSSVAALLEDRAGALRLSYGDLLTEALKGRVSSQHQLRERSATVISADDVDEADVFVASQIADLAGKRNVVVDSHALTAESYGLRAVPFSVDRLRSIPFTHIVCLTAPPEVIRGRIERDPGGRRVQDDWDLTCHAQLQASLAMTYAHTLGSPVAFIRSDRHLQDVVKDVLDFVEAGGASYDD